MPELVYVLCALTSIACAGLLFRSYRHNRSRLLLWSTLCFAFLAFNNIFLFLDVVVTSAETDLRAFRSGSALVGLTLLVIGLVWESK